MLFKRVHIDPNGIYIKVFKSEKKIEVPKGAVCETCSKEFKNEKALRMHKINAHK